MSCVYIHRNTINGKVYIGKTDGNPKVRWGNGKNYKHCTKFNRAIQKYGWENFEHEILLDGLTKEQASEFEKMYISLFDSVINGYNLAEGGQGGNGIFGGMAIAEKKRRPICQYTKTGEFIAEYDGINVAAKLLYGKKRDSGITQVCNGIGGSAHGYVWRFKEDPFDKFDVSEKIKARPVIQYSVDGKIIKIYEKITDAENETGTRHSEIVRCCRGSRKTAGGYVWKYAEVV